MVDNKKEIWSAYIGGMKSVGHLQNGERAVSLEIQNLEHFVKFKVTVLHITTAVQPRSDPQKSRFTARPLRRIHDGSGLNHQASVISTDILPGHKTSTLKNHNTGLFTHLGWSSKSI